MSLVHSIVLPTLDAASIPSFIPHAFPEQVVVPWVLDNRCSARTLLQITCFDSTSDLRICADLCEVPAAKRTAMLELSNTFNANYRWIRSSIAEEQLLLVLDLFIGHGDAASIRFQEGLKAFGEALRGYWPDVSRMLTRRGRRTRLEREVDSLLLRHGGD